jgi:hypothetical protein
VPPSRVAVFRHSSSPTRLALSTNSRHPVTFVTRLDASFLNVIQRASYDQDSVAGGIVHWHLVIFASLFLFVWAISIGCSSRGGESSSAPSSKSIWPPRGEALARRSYRTPASPRHHSPSGRDRPDRQCDPERAPRPTVSSIQNSQPCRTRGLVPRREWSGGVNSKRSGVTKLPVYR